jgi:GNAT superfamily N-acetyltransferase
MTTKLRAASAEDIPLISRLAEKIWKLHYTPIIGEKQVNYMLERMYSQNSLAEQLQKGQHFFLALLNDQPIGYISVSGKGEDFFLHKFYLNAEEQGKGYGKLFFEEMIAQFPQMKTLRLQVNRMNYKSINFYFKMGFVIEEAKNFDIGEGFSMDDYVMIWRERA